MFLERTQRMLESVEEKLKLINSIIDEILPAEAAVEYKLKVKSWIYIKWQALIRIQMTILVLKLLLRRKWRMSSVHMKMRTIHYKILLLFLGIEYLIIIINVNKKREFHFEIPFSFFFSNFILFLPDNTPSLISFSLSL